MKRNSLFVMWELLALFFLITYQYVVDLTETYVSEGIDIPIIAQSVEIIIPWTWILAMMMCLGIGIYQLQK